MHRTLDCEYSYFIDIAYCFSPFLIDILSDTIDHVGTSQGYSAIEF